MDRTVTSSRFEPRPNNALAGTPPGEESLVSDARAGLTPAQQVERKLAVLLPNTTLPLSQLQGIRPARALA